MPRNLNIAPQPRSPFDPENTGGFIYDQEQGNERRETLVGKVSRNLGSAANRLSGLFHKEQVVDTFRAGGSVDRGIGRMQGYTDRAGQWANGNVANTLSRVPGVGGYVEAVQNTVGAFGEFAGMAGHYGAVASAVENGYTHRGEIRQAAGNVLRTGFEATVDSFGQQVGFSVERGRDSKNRIKLQKAKLGKSAVRAFFSRGGSVVTAGSEAFRAGVTGARQAAYAEVTSMTSGNSNVYPLHGQDLWNPTLQAPFGGSPPSSRDQRHPFAA